MLVAELSSVEHEPFVRMRSHGAHVVFHGQIAVRSACTVAGLLLELLDDCFVHFLGEAAAGAEFRERQGIVVGQGDLGSQFFLDHFQIDRFMFEFVFHFRDNG